ncbi:hypothetical protein VFPPC_17630 [Pochonia chlamydosporia 170]|uniref:Uncharacterized protein n=1 Tax=Pochonia chlamydosporia 170 TaxID=1380566 RepID=A0A219ASC6_METCM|nr:hypothetical protein VFPPC_17630 [Pochonia chlamydosporia 170]OWT43194.1 hypothetical protein VFPPC_17630 [Pochonia chlamydosporia 170]
MASPFPKSDETCCWLELNWTNRRGSIWSRAWLLNCLANVWVFLGFMHVGISRDQQAWGLICTLTITVPNEPIINPLCVPFYCCSHSPSRPPLVECPWKWSKFSKNWMMGRRHSCAFGIWRLAVGHLIVYLKGGAAECIGSIEASVCAIDCR